jgi:hypothetical protein
VLVFLADQNSCVFTSERSKETSGRDPAPYEKKLEACPAIQLAESRGTPFSQAAAKTGNSPPYMYMTRSENSLLSQLNTEPFGCTVIVCLPRSSHSLFFPILHLKLLAQTPDGHEADVKQEKHAPLEREANNVCFFILQLILIVSPVVCHKEEDNR